MITKPIQAIKKGQFVRRVINGKEGITTYRRGEYDATYRRYSLINCDDVNREFFVRRDTILSVDFTY